jgi:hypothetical protein
MLPDGQHDEGWSQQDEETSPAAWECGADFSPTLTGAKFAG